MSGSYNGTRTAQQEAMKHHLRSRRLVRELLQSILVKAPDGRFSCDLCNFPIRAGAEIRVCGTGSMRKMAHEQCLQERKQP